MDSALGGGPNEAPYTRERTMSRGRLIVCAVLFAAFAVCVASSWATRDAMAHLPFASRRQGSALGRSANTVVDLGPWQTARALAPLAVSAEETEYAREAERLADHEVDQAFATALRQASMRRPVLKGEALELSRKVQALQQVVKEDQKRVETLKTASARNGSSEEKRAGSVLGMGADDFDVAQAQLGLDSDELTDEQQDLARAAGDERSRIQQELAAHEASMRKYNASAGQDNPIAVLSAQRYGTLATRLKGWLDQRSRNQLIQQGMQQAQTDVGALTARHNQLLNQANSGSLAGASIDKAAQVDSINKRAAQRQLLSIYDDRIQTEAQLATIYAKWSAQVMLQHRILLHLLLRSCSLMALILLCVVVVDALMRRLLERLTLDRRRLHTLQTVFQLGVRFVGFLLLLLVIFGMPREMPTIIGFTTAGITVILQDFILGFLGWFVLMGKNGIRVGDWVEINGIGGEVVETGIFRTVLLETGNWTDKGDPTGRRVTLMNSFAVRGHYFNFSTTGQWMWDQITVTIPASENSYRVVELIHKAVLEETENDARLASQEWKRVTRRNSLGQLAAASSVDMRPGIYGIDLVVRYVTRAAERSEVRNRLYQHVIDVMHVGIGPRASVTEAAVSGPEK